MTVEPEIVFIQSRLVQVSNRPHLFAHDPGGVVHRRGRGKTLALVKVGRNNVRIDCEQERFPLVRSPKTRSPGSTIVCIFWQS